tara:strand:- start:218 stop:805 length:588 start_codon:yes stop_codon:yes gene_type:complete
MSAFWKKIYNDMKERPETGYEEIEQSMFKEKMEEFIQGFKIKKLKKSKKFTPIQDQELVIVEVLWSLVNAIDKELLFHNDIEYFTDFIDTCPQPLLDSYIARLSSGEGLIGNLLTERDARMKSIVDSSISTSQLCNVKISNGKLILYSTNHNVLKKFRNIMVESGNKLQAYKEEKNSNNLTVHSYIFEIKTDDKL